MEEPDLDLTALSEVTLALSDEESGRLRDRFLATAAGLAGSPLDREPVLAEIAVAGCALPDRLVRALHSLRATGNQHGALLVENLPIDLDLPATPAGGDLPDWQAVPVATVGQLAVSSHLGDVIGFADEKCGRLVQDVVPVAGAEHQQENSGTAFLELHTEDGFHPYKPDFLSLLCLRGDRERRSYTLVGAIAPILPRLSRTCVEALRQPLFRIRYSSSFASSGSAGWSAPVAPLSGPAGDPELVADFYAMEPMTRGARWALEELATVLPSRLAGTVLTPGTLLVVDNRAAVHGRTAFTARYDGTDRWLRRCFAVADLRRSRASRPPGSRVCEPLPTIRQRDRRAEAPAPVPPGRSG